MTMQKHETPGEKTSVHCLPSQSPCYLVSATQPSSELHTLILTSEDERLKLGEVKKQNWGHFQTQILVGVTLSSRLSRQYK